MKRISKPPEERRKDIVDKARQLFDQKGFQQTSVDDITLSLNVAKGTFYYYFKTKEDVLNAVVDDTVAKDVAVVRDIEGNPRLSATEKLRQIRLILSQRYKEHYGFLQHSNTLNNYEIRMRWLMESFRCKTPLISKIISCGVQGGEFATDYPLQMAELALVSAIFLMDPSFFPCSEEEYLLRLKNLEQVLEKSLGVQPGQLRFITDEL